MNANLGWCKTNGKDPNYFCTTLIEHNIASVLGMSFILEDETQMLFRNQAKKNPWSKKLREITRNASCRLCKEFQGL